MRKPRFLQFLDDPIDLARIDGSIGERVAATDDFMAANLDEGDGFGVAGFKADGSAGGDIETEAVGLCSVEGEEGVRFNEVIVGANLVEWNECVSVLPSASAFQGGWGAVRSLGYNKQWNKRESRGRLR